MQRLKKRENLKTYLQKSDISFIARVANVSYRYVAYIVEGKRNAKSEKAKKIVALILKKIKQNKELLQN